MTCWTFDDGGRADAGFKGEAGDCGPRAISIASKHLSYQEAYDLVTEFSKEEKPSKRLSRPSSARTGVHGHTMRVIMDSLGWTWTPTMQVGSGCKTHLREDELPSGVVVIRVSKHFTVMIDGVHDPCREGTRCVYGYWTYKPWKPDPFRVKETV